MYKTLYSNILSSYSYVMIYITFCIHLYPHHCPEPQQPGLLGPFSESLV